jgi:hypothetical protein
LVSALLLPGAAWAYHPLEVEDSATEGKGNYLFEMTGDYVKDGSFKSTKLTGIITGGLGEHTDLSLEVPYLMLRPSPETDKNASGKGDVRLKVKHQIFENEVKQSMAYEVYADLPTGDDVKGLGTNNLVWGARLIDSQECHDNIFHVNIGYEVVGRDFKAGHFARDYTLFAGLALEHKLSESFRFVTEIRAVSQKETEKSTTISNFTIVETETSLYSRPVTLLGGFVYDISKSWYVDLGLRVGLNHYAEDVAVLAGTAWRF